MSAPTHRLIIGRPSRYATLATPPRTHIVGDGPLNVLGVPKTLCGKHVSGGQFTGPLNKVTCTRCLASLERQMAAVRP